MIEVVSSTERHEQMRIAIEKGFPFLRKNERFSPNKVSIVCYGPSLLDTWRTLKMTDQSMITVSGAHDFMADRNIQPTWHVEMDPRPHKPQMLRNPREGTKYLMASVCHPDFWGILKGYDVELWHLINGEDHTTMDWVAEHHPEGMQSLIGGGSTVGHRAMNVAAALGFRRFDIFGMDCSLAKAGLHAGPHTNEKQPVIAVRAAGRPFRTTPQLLHAAREMANFILTHDVDINFYGDGLMQELARTLKRKR